MAMLCFDIRSLENRAANVDANLEHSDQVWESDDIRPNEPGISVAGRVSSAGRGRFYFSGTIAGEAVSECRRCLIEVSSSVFEELQLLFVESGEDEADEADVFSIPAGSRELDLRPALREEWLLAVPAFPLCKEACLGLCSTCGADRNAGECSCSPVADPRWAGLRDVRNSKSQ